MPPLRYPEDHPVYKARMRMRREDGEPWTQQDLATAIGRSKVFVSSVENGFVPKMFRMRQIAAALQTTPEELWPDHLVEGS